MPRRTGMRRQVREQRSWPAEAPPHVARGLVDRCCAVEQHRRGLPRGSPPGRTDRARRRRTDGPVRPARRREVQPADRVTEPGRRLWQPLVVGKGGKPADIPLSVPVRRAARVVADGRTTGPLLRNRARCALATLDARRMVNRIAVTAGVLGPPRRPRHSTVAPRRPARSSLARHAGSEATPTSEEVLPRRAPWQVCAPTSSRSADSDHHRRFTATSERGE